MPKRKRKDRQARVWGHWRNAETVRQSGVMKVPHKSQGGGRANAGRRRSSLPQRSDEREANAQESSFVSNDRQEGL